MHVLVSQDGLINSSLPWLHLLLLPSRSKSISSPLESRLALCFALMSRMLQSWHCVLSVAHKWPETFCSLGICLLGPSCHTVRKFRAGMRGCMEANWASHWATSRMQPQEWPYQMPRGMEEQPSQGTGSWGTIKIVVLRHYFVGVLLHMWISTDMMH